MWSTARTIQPGDVLIVWLTRDLIQPIQVTPGADLNIRFGYYRHDDLVGVPYGSKVASRNNKGFVHVLRPTPELWTHALPHRTQILYLADIALVSAHLNLRPGARVVEAGTGSGSFSHAAARSVGPNGHLYSFEFHHTRFLKATDEFTRHGLVPHIATLAHRNVCKDGFTPGLEDSIDAVFLDLPMPWDAVGHAKSVLRKDRIARICCFSPCMEQVLRTVTALNDAGFSEITMYETLMRPHEVSPSPPPLRTVQSAATALVQAERVREDRRLRQVASASRAGLAKKQEKSGKTGSSAKASGNVDSATAQDGGNLADAETGGVGVGGSEPPHGEKRKRGRSPGGEGLGGSGAGAGAGEGVESASPAPEPLKKARLDGDGDDVGLLEEVKVTMADNASALAEPLSTSVPLAAATATAGRSSSGGPAVATSAASGGRLAVSRAFSEVRGHTSYLTFACLLPAISSASTPTPAANET